MAATIPDIAQRSGASGTTLSAQVPRGSASSAAPSMVSAARRSARPQARGSTTAIEPRPNSETMSTAQAGSVSAEATGTKISAAPKPVNP